MIPMEWLNYHHLYYFWTVAHEGSIARASEKIKLSQPTLSAQIHQLEENMGKLLFKREGRGLILTEVGRFVLQYADEIFRLGNDMLDALGDRGDSGRIRMQVGIADIIPKLIAHHILASAVNYKNGIRLLCHEDKSEALVMALATHKLDLVISESPVSSLSRVKVFSHLIGESQIALFGVKKFFQLRKKFPQSLDGAPMLLPSADTVSRRQIDSWLDQASIKPKIVGEFDDMALLKIFAASGAGLFFAPQLLQVDLKKQYAVEKIGDAVGLKDSYYAITVARKIKHPVVSFVLENARTDFFKQANL